MGLIIIIIITIITIIIIIIIQSNLPLRPPLVSNHFSKIQKVFKLNYYRWNLS